MPDAGYAYVRIAQWPPHIGPERKMALALFDKGLVPIIDEMQIRVYDNKIAQAEVFADFMPRTLVLRSKQDALDAIGELGFPFMSKASYGSGSRNVRLVETAEEARGEVALAFGRGLPPTKGGQQKGYVYWQDFCADNRYDYRVHVIGRERAICRRWNRPGTVVASGSKQVDNLTGNEAEAREVLAFADKWAKHYDIRYACIDVVRGKDGWRFLESSIGWASQRGSWMERRFVSGRACRDIADVICDEMEAGVFDRHMRGAPVHVV
jgi:glutathione synthase/RimK-type ligase-like ATP-grasp enzyme